MQEVVRESVLRKRRDHRPDHGHLVGTRSDVRKQIADRQPAFAVLLKRPERLQHRPDVGELSRLNLPQDFLRSLAVVLVEHRLWVKRIDLRRPAVHVEEQHMLGLRGMMRPKRNGTRAGTSVRR